MKSRVLVVRKRSSLERYLEGKADTRAADLLAKGDVVVSKWKIAHEAHQAALATVLSALEDLGVDTTVRSLKEPLPDTAHFQLVVTVGGDGTLLGTSHAMGSGVPVLGVNSAPGLSVGFFCATDARGAKEQLRAALEGTLGSVQLTRMRIVRNGTEELTRRVLNEILFCHNSPAATSRYLLSAPRGPRTRRETHTEDQRSSGLWVGPPAGSTAAQRSAGGKVLPLTAATLQFVVREPYVPLGERLALRRGLIAEDETLTIRSKMRSSKIFVDGEELVLPVELGDVLLLSCSPEPLVVLGLEGDGGAGAVETARKKRRPH